MIGSPKCRALAVAVFVVLAVPAVTEHALAQSRYSTSEAQELLEQGVELESRAEQDGDADLYEEALEKYLGAIEQDPTLNAAYERVGYLLYVLKRSDEAVDVLSGALKHSPGNPELKHYLAINLYQLGKEEKAAAMLEEVVGTGDFLPEALFILGKYYLDHDEPKRAREYFGQYRDANPNDPLVHRALATIYLQQEDVEGAQEALTRLVELAPKDVEAQYNLGHVYFADQRYDEAIESYNNALKLASKRYDIRYDKASLYYLTKQYEKALKEFEAILEQKDDHFAAIFFRADCLLQMNEFAAAREAFFIVLDAKPGYAYGHLKMAELALLEGDEAEAKEWLRKASRKDDEHPDVLSLSGVLHLRMGNPDKALEVHERLIELEPDVADHHILLANDYLIAEEPTSAVEQFRVAVENDPINQVGWRGLSTALLYQSQHFASKGKTVKAEEALREVMELDIHSVEGRVNLAILAFWEEDISSAKSLMEEASQLAPEAPAVLRLNARLLLHESRNKEAIQSLEKIIEAGDEGMTAASWQDLAIAYGRRGEWANAHTAIGRATQMGLEAPRAVAIISFRRALKHINKQRWRDAEELLEQASNNSHKLTEVEEARLQYATAIVALKLKKFGRAERYLKAVKDRFAKFSGKERKALAAKGKLNLRDELAYAFYRNGKYSAALDLVDGAKGGNPAAIERVVREQLGITAFEKGKFGEANRHFERAAKLGETDSIVHNLAAAEYENGEQSSAAKVFQTYAKRGITQAMYNYAIYLDDVVKNPEQAFRYYLNYIDAGGTRKDKIEKMLETKRRVFGLTGGAK